MVIFRALMPTSIIKFNDHLSEGCNHVRKLKVSEVIRANNLIMRSVSGDINTAQYGKISRCFHSHGRRLKGARQVVPLNVPTNVVAVMHEWQRTQQRRGSDGETDERAR